MRARKGDFMLLHTERISTSVKTMTLAICVLVIGTLPSYSQSLKAATPAANAKQELVNLSKQKWN
jgi:hypothetical protein